MSTPSNPFFLFDQWFTEAKLKEEFYPDSFTLATADSRGTPSARTVLLKKIISDEAFVFFTNYKSQKAQELLVNPNVHMLFYWKSTQKQVRIKGTTAMSTTEISDEYWATRAVESRINSAMSKQSSKLEDSFDYDDAYQKLDAQNPDGLKRPDNWGGFTIKPHYFEFWSEGDHRWHSRKIFELDSNNSWQTKLLYP